MNYKKDFPIFKNNEKLIYLNNGATTLKPQNVIDEITHYYTHLGSNVGRGEYVESVLVTDKCEDSRTKAAEFLNANSSDEIIFTPSTTYSLNIISFGLEHLIKKDDEIIVTRLEHASNLLPWINLAKRKEARIVYAELDDEFKIDSKKLEKQINKKTKIIAFNHFSNSVSGLNDAKEIVSIARKNNVISIVDAAQSVGHLKVDVSDIDANYLVFAPHKMFADAGLGVIWAKKADQEALIPVFQGGGTARGVLEGEVIVRGLPDVLEPGTPNITGIISLKPAIEYIEKIGIDKIWTHSVELREYAIKRLNEIEGMKIYNPNIDSNILCFNIEGYNPQDLSQQLAQNHIAVRTGTNCALCVNKVIDTRTFVRMSFSIYNTNDEIDKVVDILKEGGDMLDAFFD